jgi:hypothetical protein
VLIVVDAAGALASGGLVENCYVVDTNGYLGSWREGTEQLHTVCEDGQALQWSASAVAADTQVAVAGFSGPMVDGGVCAPAPVGPPEDGVWMGRVESRGVFASFQYTVTLSFEGRQMQASCSIKVV